MKKISTAKVVLLAFVTVISIFVVLSIATSLYNASTTITTSKFFSLAGIEYTTNESGEIEISFKEQVTNEAEGKYYIDKIIINVYNIEGYSKKADGKYVKKYEASLFPTDLYELEMQILKENGIEIDAKDPNAGSLISSLVFPIITIACGVLILFVLMRQMNGANKGAMDFGKTKAKVSQNIKVRFTDVAGAEEEKEELAEVVEFLKNPKKFSSIGAKIPKGVLLVGPPGTGKTLFAKAVAGEANVPFFSISGSDFVEMFVGVGASRVRDLFNMAKKSMPCIIFIDEIDAVGRHRGAGVGGGNDEREQTLNQLLVQMDGFDANEGVIIIAATNRADILDPALLRPGRFDRQVYVNIPDVRGREAILKIHARNKPMSPEVNFKTLARMTVGFSGADLANLLNEAAILAARKNQTVITNIDLYEGINKVIIGPQKKSRLVTETDKRITAYHESGHAILGRLLPSCDPVQEVSIIPRGGAAGYTLTRPDSDDNHVNKTKLYEDIIMTLGGRVAEELVIKDISTGASNDIMVVTSRARKMVTEWGMSKRVGTVNYGDNDQVFIGRDMQTKSNYSETTATAIDEEISRIISEAYQKATELLSENRALLDNMSRLLIERETIYQDEIDMLMEGKSVKEIIEFMEKKDKETKSNPFAKVEGVGKTQETTATESKDKVEVNTENKDEASKTDAENAQDSDVEKDKNTTNEE